MIKITGSVTGAQETMRYVQALSVGIRDELRVVVDKLGSDLLERSKRMAVEKLNKAPKGNLVGAINKKTVETKTSITSTVGISLGTIPYARIHEFGGVILPKNGPYLTFMTPDGAWHKVTSVTIPERSYLRAALAAMVPTVEKQIRLGLKRAVARSGLKGYK